MQVRPPRPVLGRRGSQGRGGPRHAAYATAPGRRDPVSAVSFGADGSDPTGRFARGLGATGMVRRVTPPHDAPQPSPGHDAALRMEAEVLPGLAPFARAELDALPGAATEAPLSDPARADAVPFTWRGDWAALDGLRTVTAVYRVLAFEAPRPKALLGDAHFRRLSAEIRGVVDRLPGGFSGLRVEAAGRESAVMRRLRAALSEASGLPDHPETGDLRIRVRPTPGARGWEVLLRLTPRPLSARPWRTCNMAGGLNACLAAACWDMIGVAPDQRVLNAMSGSATLLIERARRGPAARLTGVDLDEAAILCGEANLRAAGVNAELVRADATATPWPSDAFDVVVADPPWGDAVGHVHDAYSLTAAFLGEAARVLVPGGRLLVVTHTVRAFEEARREAGAAWDDLARIRVFHGGHRPEVRLLRARPA